MQVTTHHAIVASDVYFGGVVTHPGMGMPGGGSVISIEEIISTAVTTASCRGGS